MEHVKPHLGQVPHNVRVVPAAMQPPVYPLLPAHRPDARIVRFHELAKELGPHKELLLVAVFDDREALL
jgi:hypothetical protein